MASLFCRHKRLLVSVPLVENGVKSTLRARRALGIPVGTEGFVAFPTYNSLPDERRMYAVRCDKCQRLWANAKIVRPFVFAEPGPQEGTE